MFKKSWNFLLALIVTWTVTASIIPNRSEALVGLIFKNRIVKVIGGATALGGATLFGVGAAIGSCVGGCVGTWTAFWAAIFGIYFGIIMAGFGILVLDDGTLMEIEYSELDLNDPKNLARFSAAEMEEYNNELPILNSVRQTIMTQLNDKADTSDAEKLWKENAHYLSDSTKKIAASLAQEFVVMSDKKIRAVQNN